MHRKMSVLFIGVLLLSACAKEGTPSSKPTDKLSSAALYACGSSHRVQVEYSGKNKQSAYLTISTLVDGNVKAENVEVVRFSGGQGSAVYMNNIRHVEWREEAESAVLVYPFGGLSQTHHCQKQ